MAIDPTTTDKVKEVIEVDEDIDLDPFIDFANEIVDELCTGSGYSSTRLTDIQTWLAAHFYAMRDPQVRVEDAGKIRAEYQHKVDYGFRLSHHGQQAMRMDTAGNLAAVDNALNKITRKLPGSNRPTRFHWLGTDPCDS